MVLIQLLTKMIKQRKESAKIYKESDRSDLEKKENDEIEIIEQYMPSQINDDEIDKLINEIIDHELLLIDDILLVILNIRLNSLP